jgi:hypothetical protein
MWKCTSLTAQAYKKDKMLTGTMDMFITAAPAVTVAVKIRVIKMDMIITAAVKIRLIQMDMIITTVAEAAKIRVTKMDMIITAAVAVKIRVIRMDMIHIARAKMDTCLQVQEGYQMGSIFVSNQNVVQTPNRHHHQRHTYRQSPFNQHWMETAVLSTQGFVVKKIATHSRSLYATFRSIATAVPTLMGSSINPSILRIWSFLCSLTAIMAGRGHPCTKATGLLPHISRMIATPT